MKFMKFIAICIIVFSVIVIGVAVFTSYSLVESVQIGGGIVAALGFGIALLGRLTQPKVDKRTKTGYKDNENPNNALSLVRDGVILFAIGCLIMWGGSYLT